MGTFADSPYCDRELIQRIAIELTATEREAGHFHG
jgi:hypothetical protein